MRQRVISALLMVPLIVFVYAGGLALAAVALVVACIGAVELINGLEHIKIRASKAVSMGCIALLYAILAFGIHMDVPGLVSANIWMLWLFVSGASALLLIMAGIECDITGGAATLLVTAYIGYFSAHAVLIERLPRGAALIWISLISAFCTDIFAYLVGTRFGRHKLSPRLSPHKTIEGAAGGLLGGMGCCALFSVIFVPDLLMHSIAIGLIGSIAAQSGDLVASAFKRKTGIKDFGTLIPGHGGILDRFDSVLFTLPAVYYYAVFAIAS